MGGDEGGREEREAGMVEYEKVRKESREEGKEKREGKN